MSNIEDLCCFACGVKKSEVSRFFNSSKYSDGKPVCNRHFLQLKRHGKVLKRTLRDKNEIIHYDNHVEIVIRDINSEEVARAKVDKEDVKKVESHKWCIDSRGYIVCNNINGKFGVTMHRFVMNVTKREEHIDHINHDRTDNRKCNLRVCMNKENSRNKGYARSNTGYIGVSYIKSRNKYGARIKVDYEMMGLGNFSNLDDAIRARLKAEKKYFGEFAPQQHLFKEYGIGVEEIAR